MRRLLIAAAVLLALLPPAGARASAEPQVVIALIDTGINPYSDAFRDPSALAQQPPSTYIPGYPQDCPSPLPADWEPTTSCAIGLHLTFGVPFAQAFAADRAIWNSVKRGQLYYFAGTRIVGGLSMGVGGSRCPIEAGGVTVPGPPPPLTSSGASCIEVPILDNFGHGTMTASRAAGSPHSLAPSARIVEVEGVGAGSSAWAASQPWIDVQSNSWGSLLPAPLDDGTEAIFTDIAQRQLVFVASGNGVAGNGAVPTPTTFDSLGAAGVVLVGGHDNGRITPWAGAPAQVVADAYGGYTAIHDSTEPMRPDPVACCTSAAAPYAAGGAAQILLDARTILGDTSVGIHDGIAARGSAGAGAGPLADGVLTLDEWRTLVLHSAEARPQEGRDDGAIDFTGEPGAPHHPEYGLGENPYCALCVTLPWRWADVQGNVPVYVDIGYGAINERSVWYADGVMVGILPEQERPAEDAYFATLEQVRHALWNR